MAEPVHETAEMGLGDQSKRTVEERTGAEAVLKEAVEETGAMPVRERGESDLNFEDYPGDDFEKRGEFTPEETS